MTESETIQPTNSLSRASLTRTSAVMTLTVLSALLLLMIIIALLLGSEPVSAQDIFSGLFAKITGGNSALSPEREAILFSIRLPRILLAIGVGAALAQAGAALQALLRNPLADPYVLGVSGGAAVGAITAMMFFSSILALRPVLSFLGALLAAALVYWFGRRDDDPSRLILAGVITTTFLSSLIALLTTLADDVRLRNITYWLLGDLSGGSREGIVLILIAVVIAVIILTTQARALNLLMLGEREAFALGVETVRVRWVVFAVTAMLVGAAVSVGGAVGYVGLVVPHLIRLIAGADNRLTIPAATVGGALMALCADTIARTLFAPRELPTGAITALIGAPVFIFLLLRTRTT